MPFEIGPAKVVVSSTVCTVPVLPGAMVLSYSATVQPQAGRTLVTWSGAPPSLRRTKSCVIFSPLGTVPASLTASAITALGAESWAAAGSDGASRAAQSARMAVDSRRKWRFIRPAPYDQRRRTGMLHSAAVMAKPLPALDIYCLAVGGTGMAPLACLLQEQGHRVRGTDGPLYPPMSTLLETAGIHPHTGYDPSHLEPRPDLVVIGNAIHRNNPEAVEAERLGLPIVSMPQALSRFFLDHHRSLVVTGTHGKTTTTAMAASVYAACGRDPGYLIGGAPRDLPASFHDGAGDRFIIEGDEYNAAYFDRGHKFLHYQPQILVVTSAEYDHADLYASPEALWEAYSRLLELVPDDGLLIACGDDPKVRELAAAARCRTLFYGLGEGNDLHPEGGIEALPEASRFRVRDAEAGEVEISLPLAG